jgi:putative phage-type endonuclease
MENQIPKVKSNKVKVKALLKRPQPTQRSEAWYTARKTMITASEASSCLYRSKKHCQAYVEEFKLCNFKYKDSEPLNPYETREDYIIKKAALFYDEYVYKDSIHTLWGKKYEDSASRLYCKLYNVKLLEFGLVPHGKLKWLAASPDGITEDGIMLEIKCPKSRKIDPTQIPLYYWIQTQIQLEVCNLDFCDFIECELEELLDETCFLEKTIKPDQDIGITIQIPDTEADPKFVYPSSDVKTKQEYIDWKNNTVEQFNQQYPGKQILVTYYFISRYNITRISRSKLWFAEVKEDIKSTWDIIRNLQSDKEIYKKYKESIYVIKNKAYLHKYNTTECVIHDNNSTFFLEEFDNNCEINKDIVNVNGNVDGNVDGNVVNNVVGNVDGNVVGNVDGNVVNSREICLIDD